MNTLKDGSSVDDLRLDRLEHFDERSRDYPIMAMRRLEAARKPRSYTWRCTKMLDQGREGACVGFAWSHELAARPSEVLTVSDGFARTQVYWEAQKIDPWEGGSYPGASPRYEGSSVLAGAKVIQSMGYIKEYRWAFGLDEVVMTLGYHGPVVLGIPWYESMYRPDKKHFIRPSGRIVGGHAILANGVNVRKGVVRLHNSWGMQWGKLGEAFITFDDLGRLLEQRGEACVAVGRRTRRRA